VWLFAAADLVAKCAAASIVRHLGGGQLAGAIRAVAVAVGATERCSADELSKTMSAVATPLSAAEAAADLVLCHL